MKRAKLPRPTDAELMRVIRSVQTYELKYIAVARLQGQDSIRRVALDNGLNWKVRKAAVCRLQDRETLSMIAAHDRHDYLRSMAERRLSGASHPVRISRYSVKDRHYDWKRPVFFKLRYAEELEWAYAFEFGTPFNMVFLHIKGRCFGFALGDKKLSREDAADILQFLRESGSFSVTWGDTLFYGRPAPRRTGWLELGFQFHRTQHRATCRTEDFIGAVKRDLLP